jgi:hypothetical protein
MIDSIFNPLKTRTEKYSNWAEILTTVPSHFFKNLLLLQMLSQNKKDIILKPKK